MSHQGSTPRWGGRVKCGFPRVYGWLLWLWVFVLARAPWGGKSEVCQDLRPLALARVRRRVIGRCWSTRCCRCRGFYAIHDNTRIPADGSLPLSRAS